MSIDFNALRSRRGSSFDAIQKKLEQTNQGGGFKKDERIWKPVANKDNKSSNIIRFLPTPYVDMVGANEGRINELDLVPMAKVLHHSFQGPTGSWFIEKSLQTFGEKDAIREHDGPLWKQAKDNNDESLKNILKKRLPKTTYYANVLVIKDGTNPENNGKIMIYEFGETVRKLLEKCNKPEFESDPSFDPFDPWEGADLLLNLTYTKKVINGKEANVPVFDSVKWAAQRPLADGNEEEIERLWKAEHSMSDYYDRKNFKTYEEIKTKFEKVMGIDGSGGAPASAAKSAAKDVSEFSNASSPEPQQPSREAPKAASSVDSDLEEFERLLNGN